jgi:hydroxyacylglutathione hydrolase
MYFRQVYDARLAQASYFVASTQAKAALVVDPQRDVDIYQDIAREQDVRITAVAETHIHADFLSGARELSAATGASLYLSDEGQGDHGYLTDRDPPARFLRNGDAFELGELLIRALHTPGHTPEHLAFEVFDGHDKSQPMLLLSGDFMFVGDLGRPDLLEAALGQTGSAKAGARQMYFSLQTTLAELPDFVQVWPGHGAGSACGRALGQVPSTTLGYERRFAWWSELLNRGDEPGFVEALLADQPDAPSYFATMKQLNRGRMRVLNGLPQVPRLDADALREQLAGGALLVDTRPRDAFVASHARNAIHIADGSSFSNWSAWFIPSDARVVLVAEPERVASLVRGLVHVGIDTIAGFVPEALARTLPQASLPRIDARQAHEQLAAREAAALDVRSDAEFQADHIPGALHVSAGRLLREARRLPKDRPLIVCCAEGDRSAAAASVLLSQGFSNVLDLAGGFNGWRSTTPS